MAFRVDDFALVIHPFGESGLNYLCSGYKQFFTHANPHLRGVARHASGASRQNYGSDSGGPGLMGRRSIAIHGAS